jgi:hypothetical protein
MHSDKGDVRFQEYRISSINQGVVLGLIPPRYGRSAHARQSPAGGVLGHFFLELHQMLRSNLHIGFPSGVSDFAILPAWVNLLLQRDDVAGHPMGGHIDSCQAALFQEINLVGQGCDMGEFKRSRLFTPRPLKFRESAYEWREARFMVLAVEPSHVPSVKGSLHWKVKEAGARAGLETHVSDNLAVVQSRISAAINFKKP